MKDASLISALHSLLLDCGDQCSTKQTHRDVSYAQHRIENEGISFMTITLPSFAKDFFQALELGFVDSLLFPGWKKHKRLPAFLQGFTSRVFNIESGRILDDPDVKAIRSVRQICLFFKKINLPCTPAREAKAFKGFVQTDNDLAGFSPKDTDYNLFKRVSRLVISSLFPGPINVEELIPRHGPGSTMERVQGNVKYNPCAFSWYRRLEKYFPASLNLFNTEESYNSYGEEVVLSESAPSVRVIAVPKTLSTPRIIALEPVAMQYTQQALKDLFVRTIERNPLTAGHVNFTDQSINQRLAIENSISGRLATIDLSEASDRVSRKSVKAMLEVHPQLASLVFTTRSPIADVNGKRIKLNKFASMGSAMCFPIEALYFFILCLVVRLKEHCKGDPSYCVTPALISKLAQSIYVYGDDILIPANEVEAAVDLFSGFHLKVSTSKSFWKGRFRESCGTDAYDGVDVTPVYMRHVPPSSTRQASAVISTVATANQLDKLGYSRCSDLLKDQVEKCVGFKLPTLSENSEGLGWVSGKPNLASYNPKLQRLEVQTLVPTIHLKKDELEGYPALLKCLLKLEHGPSTKETPNHMEFLIAQFCSGRPTKFVPSYSKLEQLSRKYQASDVRHLSKTPRTGSLTLKIRRVPVT